MPNLANITIKKANGSTDVTYSGIVAAAGDNSPALLRDSANGDSPAFQPAFSVRSKWNGPRTARRVEGSFVYHHTAVSEDDGQTKLIASFPITFVATVPQNAPSAVADEAAAQFANLMASTLIKSVVSTGYAPT
jgi:hypothetical protein